MTISATATFELTRDQLLRRAFQLAGLLESAQSMRADDAAMASDLLGMELDSLQAEGVLLRHVERTTKALVAGTAAYTLDTDTVDVFVGPDNVAGTYVPSSGGESVIRAISRQEYIQITNKTTQAVPSLVYIEKTASVVATFWPVPAATSSYRYSKVRFPRDADTGTVTLDVARKWQKALCYQMAWQIALAKSAPAAKVAMLKGVGESEKRKALMNDVESPHAQLYVSRYY